MKREWMIAGVLMAVISLPFVGGARAEDRPSGSDASGAPFPGDPNASFSKRSESTALLWSLLATVVPAVLTAPTTFGESEGSGDGAGAAFIFLGSVMVGPSLGHFYAGCPGRAMAGIGIRTAALIGLSAAIAATWDGDSSGGNVLAFTSLGIGAGFIVWDIASAPGSARRYNESHRRSQVSLGLGPVGSTGVPGVRFAASF
jgi:hypothetical protein